MAELELQHGLLLSSPQQAALLASALLLVFLLVVRRQQQQQDRLMLSKLPSPPGRLPIIGHLHLLGPLPHVSLRDLAAKHGRDGLLLLRLGAVPTLVVSSPAAAQAVLRTHDHVFASRPHSPVTDILFYGSTDVAFSPYGEHWRQVKKMATTHLLSNRKVRSYRHAREQEVSLVMAKIRIHLQQRENDAMDLSEMLSSFANDVICRAVSGKFFREEGRSRLFRELVDTNSSLMGGFNLEDYFPFLVRLDMVKRMVCARAQKVHRMWDDLLENLIDGHRHADRRPATTEEEEEADFIDVLLSIQQEYKLTRDHIKAQLAIMFQAGTDTSFITLEYAMVELMRNPQVMSKLQAEVRTRMASCIADETAAAPGTGNKKDETVVVTEDEVSAGMPYLEAVIKETLRLHTPGPLLVPHLSMADCDVLEGYTVPSGTRVIVNGWALAMDPGYWERPEEFMPERFMDGGSAAAVDYKGNHFIYLPFGSGRRICPGINFAISTVEVMLANLVYHFNWELPPGAVRIDMTESFGVTVHRKEKLLLVPVLP